jgi:hypothetical protein
MKDGDTMISYKTSIRLDISGTSQAEVVAKQDDNATREVEGTFIKSDGTAISISSGIASVEVRILRPDNCMVVLDNARINANKVLFTLPENALAVSGRGYGDVRLLGSNGEVLSATRFILTILPSAVSNRQISSSSDFAIYRKDLDTLAANMGGMKLVLISQSDYDDLEAPDSKTVYYVVDENGKVTQYLGAVKLSSGSGGTPTETAVYLDSSPVGIMGAEALVDEIDLTDLEWEQGTILNTGDSASRTDRIRTIGYIELSAEWQSQTVYLIARTTSDTDLSCWLAYYDSDKKYISGSSTVVSGSSVQIPSDTVYVRMVAQQTSSSASISVSDLGTAKFFKYVKEV